MSLITLPTIDFPNIASDTPLWLALLTTFIAAMSGALRGRDPGRVRYDIVGIVVFAFFLGVGGGVTRDLLLGNTPPVVLREPAYVIAVLAAVALVLVVGRWIARDGWLFLILDALTLGLYAVIGAQMAIEYGLPDIGAIIVGFLASLVGGIIVAVLRGDTPEILMPGQPYALLSILGATIYVLTDQFNATMAALLCVGSVIALRIITVRWNLRTPSIRTIGPPRDTETP
jgi:uncharacterized membrane protein YeiH